MADGLPAPALLDGVVRTRDAFGRTIAFEKEVVVYPPSDAELNNTLNTLDPNVLTVENESIDS